MTREEAVNILKDWDGYFIGHSSDDVYNALDMAIEALEKEPCGDAVSRQAVLELQYRIDDSATLSARDVVNVEDIEDLPSVTPQTKIGRWIDGKRIEHCRMFLKDPHAVVSECGRYEETDLHKSIREGLTETWNGYHGQITAPKGTFERIFNDEDNDI